MLKVVSKGQLVETDRSGLVAGYVGQTAAKVNKVCDEAKGGVLFIDEAYALVTDSEQDFGAEAVATLLKRMEDDRADLVVIVAGYPAPMTKFLDSNPGLRSRFTKTIEFPDYTDDELVTIFESIGKDTTTRATQCRRGQVAAVQARPGVRASGTADSLATCSKTAVARQASRIVGLEEPDRRAARHAHRTRLPASNESRRSGDSAPDARRRTRLISQVSEALLGVIGAVGTDRRLARAHGD